MLYRLQFQLAVSVKPASNVSDELDPGAALKANDQSEDQSVAREVTMTRYRCVSMTNVFSFMKLFNFPCKVSEVEVKHVSSHPMCPTVLKVGKMISKCPHSFPRALWQCSHLAK